MNRRDWRELYGDAPEEFHRRLMDSLDGLKEEERMNKRGVYRVSRMLIAAAIAVMVLTGGALAANRLGLFRMLTQRGAPITPLEGADDMVQTDLGSTKNELAELIVEEAVFDGQGAMVQCLLRPVDENDALFSATLQDATDEYVTERVPLGDDMFDTRVTGRKDGKRIIDYWVSVESQDDRLYIDTYDAEGLPDGSVRIWAEGMAEMPLDEDELTLSARGALSVGGEETPLDAVSFAVPRKGDERYIELSPQNEIEGVAVQRAGISQTPLRGYLSIEFEDRRDSDQSQGIAFRMYGADGGEISLGNGWNEELGDGNWLHISEIQSFDALPEAVILEVKEVGGDALGRIECRVNEVDEPVIEAPSGGPEA